MFLLFKLNCILQEVILPQNLGNELVLRLAPGRLLNRRQVEAQVMLLRLQGLQSLGRLLPVLTEMQLSTGVLSPDRFPRGRGSRITEIQATEVVR